MTFNNEFVNFQYYTTFSHCENVFFSLSEKTAEMQLPFTTVFC